MYVGIPVVAQISQYRKYALYYHVWVFTLYSYIATVVIA